MNDILTGHLVGYTERDLLLKPEQLLGRDARHIGTGEIGTITAISAPSPSDPAWMPGGIVITLRSLESDQKLFHLAPGSLELVTA